MVEQPGTAYEHLGTVVTDASSSSSRTAAPSFNPVGVVDGVATLAVSGEVDIAAAEDFVTAAMSCLEDPAAATLRVDLAAVSFLDSSGLGALVRARNHAQTLDKAVVVANVGESVMKVFTITGLAGVLTFENSGSEASGPDGSVDG